MSDLILRPSEAQLEADRLARQLEAERQLRLDAEERASTAEAVVNRLRHQLRPFYDAMRGLFNEMDKVSGGDPVASAAPAPGHSQRTVTIWESWKDKLGRDSTCARVIDALLQHEEMTVAQLRVACKAGQQTIYDATSKMARLGLIDRSAGKYRLKKL